MSLVEHVDVVVVGAGISGIGAAYHLQQQCPDRSFVILEGRPDIGGTWDLFRYPGVRSDSDMHTLGYSFKPWKADKAIADGPSILAYLRETVAEYDIEQHIRFDHHVNTAEWSSDDARWTVTADRTDTGETVIYTCSFLFMCSGYYSYQGGYTPEFPGIDRFEGEIVHPQKWPEDLDYAGKRVVVIGSGATAMTLVPAMAGDGRPRHDAAALADLRRLAARHRRDRQHAPQGAPRQVGLRDHPPEEHQTRPVLLPADPHPAGEDQEQAARPDPQGARPAARRSALHTRLQPVGPAPVPDPQRRPLRGDQRRHGVGGHRPHRHVHRDRDPAPVGRAPRRRHHRHGDRAAAGHGRRDGLHDRRRAARLLPNVDLQRASPTPTFRTWRRRSGTSTHRGRCGPT